MMTKSSGGDTDLLSNTQMTLLAQRHTRLVIAELVRILKTSKNDAARVAAASMIIDRAYGKPSRKSKEEWISKQMSRLRLKRLLDDCVANTLPGQ
jgi:hypothetical protein